MKKTEAPAAAAAEALPAKLWVSPLHTIAHGYQKLQTGVPVELDAEAARYYVSVRWAEPCEPPAPPEATADPTGADPGTSGDTGGAA